VKISLGVKVETMRELVVVEPNKAQRLLCLKPLNNIGASLGIFKTLPSVEFLHTLDSRMLKEMRLCCKSGIQWTFDKGLTTP